MIPGLDWLTQHRRTAVVLASAYFAVATLGHDVTQDLAYWAQDKLNRERWNDLNRYVGVLAVIGVGVWCALRLRRCPRPSLILVVTGVTAVCAVVSFNTLFVMNVEMIHFPQYAVMALLVYPLTRRFGETVLIATMLGAVDEGYQYLVLHGHWSIYFDINDVTINLLGAGFGVILVYLARSDHDRPDAPAPYTVRRLVTSPAMIVLSVVVLLGVLGALTGKASVLPRDDAWLVLRRCGQAGAFWVETEWGKRYHIMQPWEGLVLWMPLLVMYVTLDFAGPKRKSADQSTSSG